MASREPQQPLCRPPLSAIALILLLAIVAAIGWSNTLHDGRLGGWHLSVINGEAPAPDQYRLLTPMLAHTLYVFTDPGSSDEGLRNLRYAYLALHAVAFTVAGLFFVAFSRRWLSESASLLACALLMAIAAIANLRGQIQVADPMNLMFVTVGLWAIAHGRFWPLLVAIFLGALNRESILVLLGYFVLIQWPRPKRELASEALVVTLAWGAAYGLVRGIYGMRPYSVEVVMLPYNLESAWRWAPPLLLMAPLLIAALQRPIAQWPPALTRATLVIPPYLLLHLVIARLEEVRLFLPLLPVLIVLAVGSVAGAPNEEATAHGR